MTLQTVQLLHRLLHQQPAAKLDPVMRLHAELGLLASFMLEGPFSASHCVVFCCDSAKLHHLGSAERVIAAARCRQPVCNFLQEQLPRFAFGLHSCQPILSKRLKLLLLVLRDFRKRKLQSLHGPNILLIPVSQDNCLLFAEKLKVRPV